MNVRIGGGWMAAALLLVGASARADDTAKKPAAAPARDAVLTMEEGTWDAEVTVFVPGGDKAFASKAVETNHLLGGKWLISNFDGEFGGMPFQGHAQYGYDAKKGKYVGTWLDSMSTHIDALEGSYDPATKTLTLLADTEDPHTGKAMKAKMVTKFQGDSRVFTESMKAPDATDYVKFMEITYKKRAK